MRCSRLTRCTLSTSRVLCVVSVLSIAVSGCARPPSSISQLYLDQQVWTPDGLYLAGHAIPGALFIRPAQAILDGYESFLIDEIELTFKEKVRKFSAPEHLRTTNLVRRNITGKLSEFGLQSSEEPGPGALRLRIAITHIAYQRVVVRPGSEVVLDPSRGAVITLEFRDSVDDNLLLWYSQHRLLPYAVYFGPLTVGAERIADAFYEFLEDLAPLLEKAERGALPGPRSVAKVELLPSELAIENLAPISRSGRIGGNSGIRGRLD